MRWKHFNTGCSDTTKITKVIASHKKEAKKEEGMTNAEIGLGLGLTGEEVSAIVTANKDALAYEVDGYLLSGNVRIFEDGRIGRGYTKAGELMVRCFEKAAQELGCPFEITGEYMLGKNWGDCH